MKKILLLSLMFAITFSPISNAEIIPGSSCKVINKTIVSGNKKFTCIKKYNKKVWNSGVIIVTTQSLQQENLPIAILPTQSTNIKLENPINTDLEKKSYYYKSYNDIVNHLVLNTPTIKTNIYISENAQKRNYQLLLDSLDLGVKFWYPFFNTNEVNVILFTEKDPEWIDKKQTDLMGNYLNNPTQQLQSYRLKQYGCNVGGFYMPNIIVACVKDETGSRAIFNNSMLLSHEYVHLVGMTSKQLSLNQIGDKSRLRPCWIEEGLATFFGIAAASKLDKNFEINRMNFLLNPNFYLDNMTKEYVIKFFNDTEQTMDTCTRVQEAYSIGSISFEKLTYDFGIERVVQFNKLFFSGIPWKDAFYSTFNLTIDEFYDKISNMIVLQSWK